MTVTPREIATRCAVDGVYRVTTALPARRAVTLPVLQPAIAHPSQVVTAQLLPRPPLQGYAAIPARNWQRRNRIFAVVVLGPVGPVSLTATWWITARWQAVALVAVVAAVVALLASHAKGGGVCPCPSCRH